MSDYVWETFNALFKTAHKQGRQIEELEARVLELERKLSTRAALRAVAPCEDLTPDATAAPEAGSGGRTTNA